MHKTLLYLTAIAILYFNMSDIYINPGQAVIFNVKTPPGVEFVFADLDGNRVQALLEYVDDAGNSRWKLVAMPRRTQDIYVYAGETNTTIRAALVIVPVVIQ